MFLELRDILQKREFDRFTGIVQTLSNVQDLLRNEYNNNSLLHWAIYYGAPTKILDLLMSKGCCLSERNSDKCLPIHFAAVVNNTQALKWILSHDASFINDRDLTGRAPIHVACQYNSIETVKCLLTFDGVDVNLKNDYGQIADECYSHTSKDIKQMVSNYRKIKNTTSKSS